MTTTIIRPAPVGIGGQLFGTFDIGDLYWDSTIVGGDDAWTDDDDATYVRLGYRIVSGTPEVDIGFGPCVLPVVGAASVTEISTTVRVLIESATNNSVLVSLINDGSALASVADWGQAVPGDDPLAVGSIITLTRTVEETALAEGADPAIALMDAATALTTDGTTLWVAHQGTDLLGPAFIRVYEVAVTVTYGESATLIGVTRQFPRDDALGLGSAPRIHPPPKGSRVAGGYS